MKDRICKKCIKAYYCRKFGIRKFRLDDEYFWIAFINSLSDYQKCELVEFGVDLLVK